MWVQRGGRGHLPCLLQVSTVVPRSTVESQYTLPMGDGGACSLQQDSFHRKSPLVVEVGVLGRVWCMLARDDERMESSDLA